MTEIKPVYRNIGRGFILIDLDITTTNTGCSFRSCGCEPKRSQNEIETKSIGFLREWVLGKSGSSWYGDDTDAYQRSIDRANRMLAAVESGGHFTNEDGQLLEEFKSTHL